MPAHVAAFVVKVKVNVVNAVFLSPALRRLNLVETLRSDCASLNVLLRERDEVADEHLVGALNLLLASLLVDQVDEIVVAINVDLFIEMLPGGIDGRLDSLDEQFRRVREMVDLRPVNRYASTSLDIRQDLDLRSVTARCRVLVESSESSG